MLFKFTHQTDLIYSDTVTESVMELRMAPRQEQDQHRLSFNLAIGPATGVTSYFDWVGNLVHFFTVSAPHKEIRIIATSVIETDRPTVDPTGFADTWPLQASSDYTLYDYLTFGGPIVDSPQLHDLAGSLNAKPGMKLGYLVMSMLRMIDKHFTYEKGITTAATPITEVLEHRRGVCQDFTHVLIGLARSMKIPARYVSGLLAPRSGPTETRGYSQTHAWCELYFPSTGWIGLDPANQCVVGSSFAKVAVGRDFRDVPPNRGVYRGKAAETISVKVQAEELPTIPAVLAAERYQSINMPTYAQPVTAHTEMITQQQEQQQQSRI